MIEEITDKVDKATDHLQVCQLHDGQYICRSVFYHFLRIFNSR